MTSSKTDIEKGGVGSGQKGHQTAHDNVVSLNRKLNPDSNPFKAHLDKLKDGSILEGVRLKTGKPLYLNVDAAMAHAYSPEEYMEAANVHYDKAQAIHQRTKQLKELGKDVPPEMTEIAKFHLKNAKSMMNLGHKTASRAATVDSTVKKLRGERSADMTKADIVKPMKEPRADDPTVKITDDKSAASFVKELGIGPRSSEDVHYTENRGSFTITIGLDRYNREDSNLKSKGADFKEGSEKWSKVLESARMKMKELGISGSAKFDLSETGHFDIQMTISRSKSKTPEIEKSIVMMGQQDSAEVDTGKFAQEHESPFVQDWIMRVQHLMMGYSFGDAPRSIGLDNAELYLVKVDDGMYSGNIKLFNEGMEDNAKVRIERMTIPSMIQFLMAKEYIRHQPIVQPAPEPIVANEIYAPPAIPAPSTNLEQKIRMLELLTKLVN